MYYMFNNCHSLVAIPPLDTSNVTNMNYMFGSCYSLVTVPPLDTSNVTDMEEMFGSCYSLVTVPPLDTSGMDGIFSIFRGCYSLVAIPLLDASNLNLISSVVYDCYSLTTIHIKAIKTRCDFKQCPLLSKESLLYIINNEAATSAITITLASYAYTRWATDSDIVAALANHPNIKLAK